MSAREELLAAVAVALIVGYVLGEKKRQASASASAASYDPLGWLNSYTTA